MFYVRKRLGDGVEMRIELYDDEIYTPCTVCGREMNYGPAELADIIREAGVGGTSVICGNCNKS